MQKGKKNKISNRYYDQNSKSSDSHLQKKTITSAQFPWHSLYYLLPTIPSCRKDNFITWTWANQILSPGKWKSETLAEDFRSIIRRREMKKYLTFKLPVKDHEMHPIIHGSSSGFLLLLKPSHGFMGKTIRCSTI